MGRYCVFVAAAAAGMVLAVAAARPAAAQAPDPALAAAIEDLATASRVLADQGVVDAYGHVSIRHPRNPNHYLLSRAIAPARVTAGDIMEFDLDSNPIDRQERGLFIERFIHGEIYKARPDVNAVVHTHSPTVVPFSITQLPLRPVMHTAAFLWPGVPVWEIRDAGGVTDLLVRNGQLGKALAATLGDKPVALMRGHGDVVVGKDVRAATLRAIYTEVNARELVIALGLGGPINYISAEEGAFKDKQSNDEARTWDLWKERVTKK
jgi:ribulose-5-phosphate 4-epimerase/fuculose-1-phosphate aldolase